MTEIIFSKMLTDEVPNEVTESTSLPADVTDDNSCRLELIEIVPLTRDTDDRCTRECDSGDWSGEVKQEEVCYTFGCWNGSSVCPSVYLSVCLSCCDDDD